MSKASRSIHTFINDQRITQLTSKNGKLSHVMHLERKIDDNICVFHKEKIFFTSLHQIHKAREREQEDEVRRFETHTES